MTSALRGRGGLICQNLLTNNVARFREKRMKGRESAIPNIFQTSSHLWVVPSKKSVFRNIHVDNFDLTLTSWGS